MSPYRMLVCAVALTSLSACHPQLSQLQNISPASTRQTFPGVDVVRTASGGFVVRIHSGAVGVGEPLYLIDDAPALVDPTRGINWIEPEDIERIEVLKNPADIAVYGPRAVNGVVLITTKRGMRARSPS